MSKTKNTQAAVRQSDELADSQSAEAVDGINDKSTEQLWQSFNDSHAGVENARATMVSAIRITNDGAMEAGAILIEIQLRTGRGKWLKTLATNCSVGAREAQRYMDLYRNRDVLDEYDPEWRSKYTLVEALEAISFNRSKQSGRKVAESRESRGKATSKPKKTKRSQLRAVLKAKAPTTAQVKATFSPFHREITVIQHAVEKVKEARTLDRIESEAIAVAKECEGLVGQCRLRREALKGGRVGRVDMTLNGRPVTAPSANVAAKKAVAAKRGSSTGNERRSVASKA